MTLEEYKAKYKGKETIEKPTKELVEAWLDDKIEVLKQLSAHRFDLVWGDNTDNYVNRISVCGFHSKVELHIHEGIEKLAGILGKDLEFSRLEEYGFEYSFTYKGVRVFEMYKEI